MSDDGKLLDGIIRQAEKEAEDIIRRAEKTAADKSRALEVRKQRIKNETDEKIAAKLSEIERQTESAVKSERRRANLHLREKIKDSAVELFYEKIGKIIGTPEYDDFLSKLIAEGVIAVGEEEVIVYSSVREEITQAMTERAAELVSAYNGLKARIAVDDAKPQAAQGISVSSAAGRINFSNTISARLRRFDEDIKQIIFSGLNKE